MWGIGAGLRIEFINKENKCARSFFERAVICNPHIQKSRNKHLSCTY